MFGAARNRIVKRFGKKPSNLPILEIVWNNAKLHVGKKLQLQDSGYLDLVEIDQQLVDWVNVLFHDAKFSREEVPAKFRAAYYFSFYDTQVKNGGHSQFIANSGPRRLLFLEDAMEATKSFSELQHYEILEELIGWIKENPSEVDIQTGFQGGRSPFLDILDDRYFSQSKEKDSLVTNCNWILGWQDVDILSEEEYDRRMNLYK
ncbi:DMP19 family protein [Roseibium sp.]|uniref:DMP19 family protein n=1 Tax=Roseibium sp. TaxID=1936156 RepID=UPI003B51D3BC